jgi:mycothiol synthase
MMAVMSVSLRWRQAGPGDLPAIVAVHEAAAATDGGSPFAAAEWLLRRWYLDDVEASLAAFRGHELIGICARRPAGQQAGSPSKIAGMIAPEHRGQGVGARLLDFALAGAGPVTPVLVETESLTEAADALYRSRGLHQASASDVMARPLAHGPPVVPADPDIVFTAWTEAAAPRFFAMYEAAFRERPGFPGWAAGTWISWMTDDEDFRADWTLLASAGGIDLGYVAGERGGGIVQVGVIPAARGRRISGMLIAEVLGRMIAAGETRAVLYVNINNPPAIAVYQRLGFTWIGRRARYERVQATGR